MQLLKGQPRQIRLIVYIAFFGTEARPEHIGIGNKHPHRLTLRLCEITKKSIYNSSIGRKRFLFHPNFRH